MCKMLIGINNNVGSSEFAKVIKAQYDTLTTQPDGIGAFVIDKDNKIHIFRELHDYQTVFYEVDRLLPDAKVVSLHTRIGTTGAKTLQNVHYFESDGHIMAHNGTISEYSSYNKGKWTGKNYLNDKKFDFVDESVGGDADCTGCVSAHAGVCKIHKEAWEAIDSSVSTIVLDPSDTLQFLEAIPKPVTVDSIKEFANEKKFNGMGIIVNKETLDMFMMVQKQVKVITNKEDFSVFFSYEPELEAKRNKWESMYGVPFIDKELTLKIDIKPKTVSYGVFQLQLAS